MYIKTYKNQILLFVFGIIVGFLISLLFYRQDSERGHALRSPDPRYPLTNHLIACDVVSGSGGTQLASFSKSISGLTDALVRQGYADQISVYARLLNSGQWVGVRENDEYIPASLVKLPLMIAYFKTAEKDPLILSRKVVLDQQLHQIERQVVDAPKESLQPNKPYTVKELIERMIVYSDNDAYKILYNLIDKQVLRSIYTDLGLSEPSNIPSDHSVSAKQFAYFLRVLYNASYLTQEYSEHALDLLSKTTFKDGIVAKLPEGTLVAHKFGERTLLKDGVFQSRELHDCGIIYAKSNPLSVCIMTRGKDFGQLSEVIQSISKKIFDEAGN
jgi:beta-lactamase class A